MSNKAIAYVQKKDFKDAEHVFDELIRALQRSLGYLTRAACTSKGRYDEGYGGLRSGREDRPVPPVLWQPRPGAINRGVTLRGALKGFQRDHTPQHSRGRLLHQLRPGARYRMNDLRGEWRTM